MDEVVEGGMDAVVENFLVVLVGWVGGMVGLLEGRD